MPQCSDYGQGWVGEYPNCRYEPSTPPSGSQQQQQFTGTVESLGYGEELAGSSWEQDWQKFFDPYDPTREEMATRGAGIDIGQLQSAWDLQSGQLGEAWGLREEQLGEAWGLRGGQLGESWALQQGQLGEGWQQRREGLGAEAGLGYRNIFGSGQQARGKSGMAFAGGAEEMQRMQLQDVGGAYERAFGLGKTAYEQAIASGTMGYEQAMETGELGYQQALETGELGYTQALETGGLALQQATTDIYQGLESDVFGQRESWEEQNRATLNVLLGSGIWSGEGSSSSGGNNNTDWVTCCDGTSQPMAALCGVGNQPADCYGNKDNPPPGSGGVGGTGTGTGTGGTGTGTGTTDPNTGWVTCCDGVEQPAAYMCGLGNQPQDCYGDKDPGGGGTGGTGDTGTGTGDAGTDTGGGSGTDVSYTRNW